MKQINNKCKICKEPTTKLGLCTICYLDYLDVSAETGETVGDYISRAHAIEEKYKHRT